MIGPARSFHPYSQERLCELPLNKVTEKENCAKHVSKNKLTFGHTKSGLKMAKCTGEIVDTFASPRNHALRMLKPVLLCNPNKTRPTRLSPTTAKPTRPKVTGQQVQNSPGDLPKQTEPVTVSSSQESSPTAMPITVMKRSGRTVGYVLSTNN